MSIDTTNGIELESVGYYLNLEGIPSLYPMLIDGNGDKCVECFNSTLDIDAGVLLSDIDITDGSDWSRLLSPEDLYILELLLFQYK